jgi:long-chain acyl-CoA synthetase
MGLTPETLSEIFTRRLDASPDAPFLLTLPEGEGVELQARSYAEITRRSASLATTLAKAGVGRGDIIACYLANSPAWIVTSFALWSLGATVAAVGTLVPAEEALRLFDLAGATFGLSVTGSPLGSPRFPVLEIDPEGLIAGGSPTSGDPLGPPPDPETISCIFFTSGTTGRSKGVRHSHRDLLLSGRKVASAYARSDEYRPGAAPADLPPGVIFNPFGHAAGYGRLSFRMWIGRANLLVPKFSVPAVRSMVARLNLDSLQLSPTMVHMLATAEEDVSLAGVKYATSGTAPLSVATRDLFETRYGIPVIQAYGMTEVGTISQERLGDALAGRRGPGSVGRVAEGVEVRIAPPDRTNPDEVRDDGEILVRHDNIPTDFVGGQAAPVDDEGWFATGDIGYIDQHGILYITGRMNDKLIVGGFNVYPAEVEDVLRRTGLVRDAVVIGMPDDRLGERPVAGVVWTDQPAPDRLLEECRAQLAHYKVPRQLFALDAVPLTPRDKVDRRKVHELARKALADASLTG